MTDSESDPRIADTLDETCHELREIADRVDDGEAEDYLNLAISNLEHVARWDREERGETPTDALRDFVTDGGLYEKYEVRKDGEVVEDCFVLEPESDPAAREALITYAEHTEDDELAADLREWVVDVCTRREADAGVDQSAALRDLHDRFTSLEHAVEEAIQDLRLGRNADDVASELTIALEGGDGDTGGLDGTVEHPLTLGKRWGDKAESNIEKWGNQRHDTLLLALIEEVGEVAIAMERHNGPGGGLPPNAVDHDQPEVVGRDLISEMADLGRRTRDYLEEEHPATAGDGDAECVIHGDPMDIDRILEEVEDTAPLCWQLYWALQEVSDDAE